MTERILAEMILSVFTNLIRPLFSHKSPLSATIISLSGNFIYVPASVPHTVALVHGFPPHSAYIQTVTLPLHCVYDHLLSHLTKPIAIPLSIL